MFDFLNLIPVGIILVDYTQIIRTVNYEICKIFGYSKDELVGKHVNVLCPVEKREVHSRHLDGYFLKPVGRVLGEGRDLFGVKKSGEVIQLEIGLFPLKLEDEKYIMAILIDIDKRKELEKLNKDLGVLQYLTTEVSTKIDKML